MSSMNETMDARIEILSRGMIQNEMLAAGISGATGLPCECMGTDPGGGEAARPGRRVVLVDCMRFGAESLWDGIAHVAQRSGRGADIILFNAPAKAGLEREALSRGIRGVLHQDQPLKQLLRGIKAVLDGELWYSRRVMSEYLRESLPDAKAAEGEAAGGQAPSAREREVLLLIAQGLTNEEIAQRLCISLSTVKKHLCNIYGKIKASNRIQAALWAVQNLQSQPCAIRERRAPPMDAPPVA